MKMVVKVGINGFGRVGRIVMRTCLQNSFKIQLSAINDSSISVEYMCYLIKFDSTHGKMKGVITHTDNEITINDHIIKVFHEKAPQAIPWNTAGVEYVVEASGMFTNIEKASGHLTSDCVKRVIVTAPSTDIPMLILGVNNDKITVSDKVLSCASSTLYCLAPIIKVLEENFGIVDGSMTSIHAMTPSMKPLDGLCLRGKHWRDHRSIHQNIIPAPTGSCKALGKIIPQVKDKISGLAFRVPIVNVSVLDLTIRLNTHTNLNNITHVIQKASETYLKNIITVSYEESVSSDFCEESHSCIFDVNTSTQMKTNYYKLICWYENEYSYACRVMDTIMFSEKQFRNQVTSKNIQVKTFVKKFDEVLQTESYQREISVNCDRVLMSETKSAVTDNEIDEKSLTRVKVQSFADYKNRKTKTDFKMSNDNTSKVNNSSIFQSSASISDNKVKLDRVKKEFSKMVNFTERLLKRTNISPERNVSKDDKNNINNEIETCGDYLKIKDDSFAKSCASEIKIDELTADESYQTIHESIRNNHDSVLSINTEQSSLDIIKDEHKDAKINVSKVENNLDDSKDILEINNTSSVIFVPNIQAKESNKNLKNNLPEHSILLNEASIMNSKENVDQIKNLEIFILPNSTVNTKSIALENKKETHKITDKELTIAIALDEKLHISKIDMNINRTRDKQKRFVKEVSDRLNKINPKKTLSKSSTKSIRSSTKSIYKVNTKMDLYDKLDSASESSDNDFDINGRKSQVIHITDLCGSFEDIERLDKICRIIEVSDELSDQLFSPLSKDVKCELKHSHWSFKDLCNRIKLDEFCNNVFGSTSK